MLHQRLRDRQYISVQLVEESEVIHPLHYVCNFQTGSNHVQLQYEVRDSDLWLYRANAEDSMSRSRELLGDDILSSICPESAALVQAMCERSLPMKDRIEALLEVLQLLGEHDLGAR